MSLIKNINVGYLSTLPKEIIQKIGFYLKDSKNELINILTLSLVNKRFYRILREPKYLFNFRPPRSYRTLLLPVVNRDGRVKTSTIYICNCCGTSTGIMLSGYPDFKCFIYCHYCYEKVCGMDTHVYQDNKRGYDKYLICKTCKKLKI